MSRIVWFRSLYSRIAFGFVVLLAALLLTQALLFLWLSWRIGDLPQGRTPQQLADFVARELSDALTADPTLDLGKHIEEHFADIRRPFAVLMRDGRRISNRPEAFAGGFPSPRPRGPRGGGRRGGGGTWAPIVADGTQVGVVSVPPSPPAWVAMREFGPTLALTGLILLGAGAGIAAWLIFGPTHRRLRSLEAVARALGEGRTDVRASEAGGDEVSTFARSFNRMAEDLERRADALAASDRARRQLLADVSHELMTPLTAIRGYVQTLSMNDVPLDNETRKHYLSVVDQETYKLEAIIGDLLDLARLEGGGEEPRDEHVEVSTLFGRVVDRHLPEIQRKNIQTQIEVDPSTPPLVGSAARLEQAIQNLAANAIRHLPEGGTLTLHAEPDPAGVRIVVRDTGPGIPPHHLPHIFDRFYKADASRAGAATRSGSGLGLSIVRAIVRQHGGDITAENADGGGAVFTVTLPAAPSAGTTVKNL
ncbi:MAG TPA: HAMP domain-containing sensor histidine kinase [Vicinamibacterales bacterium]